MKTLTEAQELLAQAQTEGCVEISSGVYLHSQENIIAEQKTWEDEDESKNKDFTISQFWLITDGGVVAEIHSPAEFLEYIELTPHQKKVIINYLVEAIIGSDYCEEIVRDEAVYQYAEACELEFLLRSDDFEIEEGQPIKESDTLDMYLTKEMQEEIYEKLNEYLLETTEK
jgi:hypothetical protein